MGKESRKRLRLAFTLLLTVSACLSAQQKEQSDSLVRLMSADYIRQVESGNDVVRKAMKPVFLHNGTYLQSDSALWSLQDKIINFYGNVSLIQGDTELTSERLDYNIDENLAQFRGGMVQLRNKEDNTLRTRILDYNTKDSLAVFTGGASMRSSDGQIIESIHGTYSNPLALFKFREDVDMYTDSVFVKTSELEYDSRLEKAYFTVPIDFWKEDNMLSAEGGWYLRKEDTFFFTGDVHALTPTQETWGDSLYFYRNTNNILMFGDVQLQDSTRNAAAVSNVLDYRDSTSTLTLSKDAAVAFWETKNERTDTTYCGADTLVYYTLSRCDIPENVVSAAQKRLEAISGDSVSEFRRRASKEAEEKRRNEMLSESGIGTMPRTGGGKSGGGAPQSLDGQTDKAAQDSVSVAASDSLGVALQDSLAVAPAPDTTKIGFMYGKGNVKIFREDMQVVCDSVRFNELDSIVRFHIDPIVWNEGKRQYTSDSLFVLVGKDGIERASLMSNAFIAIQEDSVSFNQIKSTEGMAFFGDNRELARFDALGGVNCIFYMEENDVLATIDKIEGKMMSATFKDGQIDRVYYFDQIRNNLFPIAQTTPSDRQLKGFSWHPELKPEGKSDITSLELRLSTRSEMERRPRPLFVQTDIYFPGYISSLKEQLAMARNRKKASEASSSSMAADSVSVVDSAGVLMSVDTLVRDSLQRSDSLSVAADSVSVPADPRLIRKAAREARRAQRIASREARWAELDARDAAKAAAKQRRKEEREQRRQLRAAVIRAREEAKEKAILDKYIEFYQKQKDKDEREQKSESSRERTSGIETGRILQTAPEL